MPELRSISLGKQSLPGMPFALSPITRRARLRRICWLPLPAKKTAPHLCCIPSNVTRWWKVFLMSAPWSTVEALRSDPAFLAEIETTFREQDEERAERKAIVEADRGGVGGEAPDFLYQIASKWDKISGPPKAVIPPLPKFELSE